MLICTGEILWECGLGVTPSLTMELYGMDEESKVRCSSSVSFPTSKRSRSAAAQADSVSLSTDAIFVGQKSQHFQLAVQKCLVSELYLCVGMGVVPREGCFCAVLLLCFCAVLGDLMKVFGLPLLEREHWGRWMFAQIQ